jgi:DMSO/TMAO reductase YedYZ molybdopterin-dependent catalytic subunit
MSLPPGQVEIDTLPRFGLWRFAKRLPEDKGGVRVRIDGAVEQALVLGEAFHALPRVEETSDFHCVTAWSCRGLRWGGVRFVDLYERLVRSEARPRPEARFVVLVGADGYRACLPLGDLMAADVLLADSLNGRPLPVAHGAPLRLVAPAHYGYKSVKHLERIEFLSDGAGYRPSGLRFMEHERARVALEERGRGLPGRLLRYLYRPLIRPTIARFRSALDQKD